jgi:hypothetical protein
MTTRRRRRFHATFKFTNLRSPGSGPPPGTARPPGRGAADVEGAHGELGAGLADGLGRDDADGLAHVHGLGGPNRGHSTWRTRPRRHSQESTLLMSRLSTPASSSLATPVLVDLLVGRDKHLAGQGIADILQGGAAQYTLAHVLDNLAALSKGLGRDAVDGAAVDLADNGSPGSRPPGGGSDSRSWRS